MANSSKTVNATHADGKYSFRTNDFDYLKAVESYFKAINKVAQRYQITTNPSNPIILYQLENEYDYFEQSINADQLALYDGKRERPSSFKLDTYDMYAKLKDIVNKQFITVPLTTCPGNTELKGLGGIEEIIPLPNYYGSYKTIEAISYKYKHFQSKLPLYTNYPSGITETYRSASMLSRFIISGMDLVSNFNAFGFYQYGHHNSVILSFPGIMGVVDLPKAFIQVFKFGNPGDILSGFVKPPMGFMPGVLDYNGPVSPSGQLREKFFQLRRLNRFYDSFEHLIALADLPSSTKSTDIIKVAYTKDTVYFLELPNGSILLGLLNDGHKTQEIPKSSISFQNMTFPQFPFTLPTEECDTKEHPDGTINGNPERYYLMHLVLNWPLLPYIKINYSTAELLSFKTTKKSTIVHTLFIFNQEHSKYEIDFDLPKVESMSCGDANCQSTTTGLFIHGTIYYKPSLLSIKYKNNKKKEELRIIVLDRYLSGRVWEYKNDYLIGVDLYNPKTNLVSFITNQTTFYTLTNSILSHPVKADLPKRTLINLNSPKVIADTLMESLDSEETVQLQSHLPSLESLSMYEGSVYYKTMVNATINRLQIDSVSDFATIYLDSKCVVSLNPLGTRIDNKDWNYNYQFKFPKRHTKELVIRVDIWGRGNFMFPRGELGHIPSKLGMIPTGIHLRSPTVGFDSVKGILGQVKVNKSPISNWNLFHAEPHRLQYISNLLSQSQTLSTTSLPLKVELGQIKWAIFTIPPISHQTPLSLKVKGHGIKATFYINNIVIGKWISDESILMKGNYYRISREAWSLLNTDHYPISKAITTNGFTLVMELDGRSSKSQLTSVELSDAKEMIKPNGQFFGQLTREQQL